MTIHTETHSESRDHPPLTATVDVRGPRFAAWVTTAVLLAVLAASAFSTAVSASLLAVQALVFAIGAYAGPRRHPYGRIFSRLVAPRLGPVTARAGSRRAFAPIWAAMSRRSPSIRRRRGFTSRSRRLASAPATRSWCRT